MKCRRTAPMPANLESEAQLLFEKWYEETPAVDDAAILYPFDDYIKQYASVKLKAYYAEIDRLDIEAKAEGRQIG